MPGAKAALPDRRRLLVAGDAKNADRAAEQLRRGGAELGRAIEHLRQQRHRHAEQLAQFRVPTAVADVEQQRARRIGGVGRVHVARRSAAIAGSCRWCRTPAALARPPRARRRHDRAASRFSWRRNTDRAAARCAGEISASWPCLRNAAQTSAVRRSCQTIALWIGRPVARSHTTVVSRWLVMPMPAISRAEIAALAIAPRTVATVVAQISSGSCSTCPGPG